MNTLKISKAAAFRKPAAGSRFLAGISTNYPGLLLTLALIILWPLTQYLVVNNDPTIGQIDPNIWLLLLFSLICFLLLLGITWWLLGQIWAKLGLPVLNDMVSQFNNLQLWQQLGFYWASLCLLLLVAVGVLNAII